MSPDRVFRSEEITFVISFHQSDEQIPRALAIQMYTISHLMHLLNHKNLVPSVRTALSVILCPLMKVKIVVRSSQRRLAGQDLPAE
ncbi:MAG: hypothetical protein WBC22_05475 [Sedimentisphaerales bacterium]